MRNLAVVVFRSSPLWVVSATAQVREEILVPVDYQGSQIQLKAELQKPPGSGPFPVVIALHSCGGYRTPYSIGGWLALFRQQGYATLELDSFTARGHPGGILYSNCAAVTGPERATDALAAAYLLAGRPDIRRGRVGVWRGGCRLNISVAAPFVWRCLTGLTLAPFPHSAHRTGHADFPHPALGQDITPFGV
jgi:hypothetical protein